MAQKQIPVTSSSVSWKAARPSSFRKRWRTRNFDSGDKTLLLVCEEGEDGI